MNKINKVEPKIVLYNTLTRKKEELKTLEPGKVKMFVCGPTVYDYSHIGHAKTYIQMDVLARMLRASGLEVFYLQNITNIDDKIIVRANEAGRDWKDLADEFLKCNLEDMKTLGVDSVDKYAEATDYIDAIIKQVETLIRKDFAYVIEGDGIYFEIAKFKDYGKLSGRKEIKENDAQTRIDSSENKRGWNDFCLWKFSKPGEPVWEAPFGKGRPGWHIEDTAITETEFGPQYDIHGGALDLIFPHHEAEITQMEAASGKVPFVGTWVHTGFLNAEGAKMSKSLGNFYTIRDVLARGYDPNVIRLFMLQSHYRSPINFSWENLDAAKNRLRNWQSIVDEILLQEYSRGSHDLPKHIDSSLANSKDILLSYMSDDLDTPMALSAIDGDEIEDEDNFGTLSLFKKYAYSEELKSYMKDLVNNIKDILGIDLLKPDISEEQKELLNLRQKARDERDFEESDRLREQLKLSGLDVRDTENGQIWSRV
ncbi:MAG: cysteine--tRNA ligase [Candidatus Nomurabacteria bacterium]|nr:MAG: cysteine--tRNA ligase [Candidatus Nomurabacteria bacterium]HRV76109.1 cysteine--tRNA ligase [Candidatus Saccharimonadales bacterium]